MARLTDIYKNYKDIADAIREMLESESPMTPLEMPSNIRSIGTGGGITVDESLDLHSTNPVRNSAITAALNDIATALDNVPLGELEHFDVPKNGNVPYSGIYEVFNHLSQDKKAEIFNKCVVHLENVESGEPEYEYHSFLMESFDADDSIWFFKGAEHYSYNKVIIYRIGLSTLDSKKYINYLEKSGNSYYIWLDGEEVSASMNIIPGLATIRETLESVAPETIKKFIGEPEIEPGTGGVLVNPPQDTLGRIYKFEATSENSADVSVLEPLEGKRYVTSVSIETDPETGDQRIVVGDEFLDLTYFFGTLEQSLESLNADQIKGYLDNPEYDLTLNDSYGRRYTFEATSETTANISILDPNMGAWEAEDSGLVGYSHFTSTVEAVLEDQETGDWHLEFGEIVPEESGGSDITVDTELNAQSSNPIANSAVFKAVYDAINFLGTVPSSGTGVKAMFNGLTEARKDEIFNYCVSQDPEDSQTWNIKKAIFSDYSGDAFITFTGHSPSVGNVGYLTVTSFYPKQLKCYSNTIYKLDPAQFEDAPSTFYSIPQDDTVIEMPSPITVDTILNTSSNNPIANSAVATALNTKSTVSGTNDGTNWQTITINGVTKAIPQPGGASAQLVFPYSDAFLATEASTWAYWQRQITADAATNRTLAQASLTNLFTPAQGLIDLSKFSRDIISNIANTSTSLHLVDPINLANWRVMATQIEVFESDPSVYHLTFDCFSVFGSFRIFVLFSGFYGEESASYTLTLLSIESIEEAIESDGRAYLPFTAASGLDQVSTETIMSQEQSSVINGMFVGLEPATTIKNLFETQFIPAVDANALVAEVNRQIDAGGMVAFFKDRWGFGTYNVTKIVNPANGSITYVMDIFTHRDINYRAFFDVVANNENYSLVLGSIYQAYDTGLTHNVNLTIEDAYKNDIELLYVPTQYLGPQDPLENYSDFKTEVNIDVSGGASVGGNNLMLDINLLMAAGVESYPYLVFRLPSTWAAAPAVFCSSNQDGWSAVGTSCTIGDLTEWKFSINENLMQAAAAFNMAYPLEITIGLPQSEAL